MFYKGTKEPHEKGPKCCPQSAINTQRHDWWTLGVGWVRDGACRWHRDRQPLTGNHQAGNESGRMGESAWLNLSDKKWRSGSSIRFTFAPIPTSPRVPGCHGGEVALRKRGKIFSLRAWSVFSGTFPLKEIGTFSGRRRLRARNERQMAFVGGKKVPQDGEWRWTLTALCRDLEMLREMEGSHSWKGGRQSGGAGSTWSHLPPADDGEKWRLEMLGKMTYWRLKFIKPTGISF